MPDSFFQALLAHRELMAILVKRNLLIRYKGSVLGFLWSLITPLAMILIYAAFAGVLGLRRQLLGLGGARFDYLPFLVTGVVVWQFTAGSLGDSLPAIVGNANLVKKVSFPRVLLPASTVLANAVNFFLTLAILVVYLACTRALRPAAIAWVFAGAAIQIVLASGLAFLVSTTNVFFRDTEHIVSLLLLAWFFLSPVMYETSLQVQALAQVFPRLPSALLYLNPATGILACYRRGLMGMDLVPAGIPPSALWLSVLSTAILFAAGIRVITIGERRFGDIL
jgi:ABC-type polysaccharide/polyol phosphate export permease